MYRVAFDEGGLEKWEALNVIPVNMAKEKMRHNWHLFQKLFAKKAKAGASVKNQERLSYANFNAACIASDFDGIGTGSRNAAAHPPKCNTHSRWLRGLNP